MGRPRAWLSRSANIINYLERDTAEFYRRAEVQMLFEISRSAATELMMVAGAKVDANGGELTVSRQNLLAFMRNSGEVCQEMDRLKRLDEHLEAAKKALPGRAVVLPVDRTVAEWTELHNLLNVSLEPGRLTVVFSDPKDLCATLVRFGKATLNEWELFLKLCEPPPKDKEPAA